MTEPGISRDEALKIAGEFFNAVPTQSFARETMRSDVTWTADFLEEGTVEGADAVNEALKSQLAAFSDLSISIAEDAIPALFENGTVAVEVAISGTNDGDLPGVGRTGRSMEGRGMAFVTFDDAGQIAAVRTYWNWEALLAQLGMRSFARPGPVPG